MVEMNTTQTRTDFTITTVTVHQDQHPSNPRKDWDHGSVMVCEHNRYRLGDRQMTNGEKEALQLGGWEGLEKHCKRQYGTTTFLKLGLYDHSGVSMYIGGGAHAFDSAGWDSGTVGWIMDTKASLAVTGTLPEHIQDMLEGDVEVYNQYLTGDIWYYSIETRDLCVLCQERSPDDVPKSCPHCTVDYDSCHDFYGLNWNNGMAEHVPEQLHDQLRAAMEHPKYD